MNRSCKIILVPVFVFLAGFFLWVARHRLIDGDEGFYLLASRLVLEHKTPYVDFFYPQAPLLPYAYDIWMRLLGISWFSARSFSATLTAILGLLIYKHLCRETQTWTAGVAGVILFASSTVIFGWLPIVKTYSLTALLLFGAYVMIARLSPASLPWQVAAAGLFFGLSVATRFYVVALAPLLLWWIFRDTATRNGVSRICWFLCGFTIGIMPCLYLLAVSPDLFLFNNLGYHAIRTDAGFIGNWKNKFHVLREVLLGADDRGQFGILSALSVVVISAMRMRTGPALLAFVIACVLGFISILPTPSFVQYFCLCMPFLIVAAVCGTSGYVTSLRAARPKWIATLATVAVSVFVALSIPGFQRYLLSGRNVIGISGTSDAPNWTLDRVSAVSKAIDELAAPKEKIAGFWPGYIFASKADPYPGFENDFGWLITTKLAADQRLKYHIIGHTEITADFAAHTPRIAVLGNQGMGSLPRVTEFTRILRTHDYSPVRTIGDTTIFVCCSRQ